MLMLLNFFSLSLKLRTDKSSPVFEPKTLKSALKGAPHGQAPKLLQKVRLGWRDKHSSLFGCGIFDEVSVIITLTLGANDTEHPNSNFA